MDMIHLAAAQVDIMAEPGTGGLLTWMKENVISALLLVAGAAALFAGATGKVAKVVTIAAGVLIALGVVGLAVGDWETISSWFAGLFGFN